MGHKGDNKLKPKKSKLLPNENIYISSVTHPNSKTPLQPLVKNNEIVKGQKSPSTGSNKKNRKGK